MLRLIAVLFLSLTSLLAFSYLSVSQNSQCVLPLLRLSLRSKESTDKNGRREPTLFPSTSCDLLPLNLLLFVFVPFPCLSRFLISCAFFSLSEDIFSFFRFQCHTPIPYMFLRVFEIANCWTGHCFPYWCLFSHTTYHQQLCNVYLRSAVNTSYNRVWFLNQCRTRVRSYSHPWAYRVCLVCSTENQWSLNCRWIWLDAGVSRKWHVLGVTKRGPWAVSHVRMNCWNLSLANL